MQIVTAEVLAERAADGDESAFEELVVRYQDRLYTLAVRITLSDADASTACRRGWWPPGADSGASASMRAFRPGSSRIVVRKAYDVLERRGRTAEPVDEVQAVSVDSPADDRLGC